MTQQRLQFRLDSIPASEWRAELLQALERHEFTTAVELIDVDQGPRHGSSAVVDPAVLAALISGGSAVLAALIPVVMDIFRTKSQTPPATISITIHGTGNSLSLILPRDKLTQQSIDQMVNSIGAITEIDISA